MDKTTLAMFKELTEASGLPGYENEIREIIRRRLKGIASISADRLGSVICEKKGGSASPKIMLPGHMDEIGFIINGISDGGFLKFTPLGGWWDQVILAQRVLVKTRKEIGRAHV